MLLGIRPLPPTTQPPKPGLVGITALPLTTGPPKPVLLGIRSLPQPHDHPNLSLWASDLQRPPRTSGRTASTHLSSDPQAHRTETHTTGTQDTSGSSGPSCKASTSLSSPLTPRGSPQTGRAPGDTEAFYLKPGEGRDGWARKRGRGAGGGEAQVPGVPPTSRRVAGPDGAAGGCRGAWCPLPWRGGERSWRKGADGALPAPRAAVSGAECTFHLVHSRVGTDVPSYPTVSLEHREGTWVECSPGTDPAGRGRPEGPSEQRRHLLATQGPSCLPWGARWTLTPH